MCKATHANKSGGRGSISAGVLAHMRSLKGRMPSSSNAGGMAGSDDGSENGEGQKVYSPPLPPILRLLESDVLTEASCFLDAKSLATAATVCRGMKIVCQGLYPWRLLCAREWGLESDRSTGQDLRLEFRDGITGGDFRKLFPLIEEMPRGFDCSSLRAVTGETNNANGVVDGQFHRANDDAAAAGARERGDQQEGARRRGDDQANVEGRASRAVEGGAGIGRGEATWEEDVGGFWVKRVRSASTSAMQPGSAARRSDLAIEVEFHGGVGVGNRCVRVDLPLPSTVLRERRGLAARSHLARHLATSPLALFRWLLSKMAATAAGTTCRTGPSSTRTGVQHPFHEDGGVAAVEAEGGDGVGAGAAYEETANLSGSEGPSSERLVRSSSAPHAGHQQGHERQPLPRPFCFPVSLDGGVVDVTPRLVSYFEVTIGQPRCDPLQVIPDCIAVGLSEARFPLRGKMPGWDSASYGYHSDDGGAFHDAGSMLFTCGPSFGAGDVVGCGLDYSVGDDAADIFFTLNGRTRRVLRSDEDDHKTGLRWIATSYMARMIWRCWQIGVEARGLACRFSPPSLGSAFHGVKGSFYPTVGVDSACPVRMNVGREPFIFDLAAALREGGQEAAAREAVVQSRGMLSRECGGGGRSAIVPVFLL